MSEWDYDEYTTWHYNNMRDYGDPSIRYYINGYPYYPSSDTSSDNDDDDDMIESESCFTIFYNWLFGSSSDAEE